MSVAKNCQPIELILSDVDGVLTDGRIVFNNEGIETKQFHTHDGLGIRLWQSVGSKFGIVTGRTSHIVSVRAAELGVEIVRQGAASKLDTVRAIAAEQKLQLEQICFLGDDLPDLACVRHVGLGVAVANASDEIRRAADYVTKAAGGAGAVRETIEMILKAQGHWEDLLQKFENS